MNLLKLYKIVVGAVVSLVFVALLLAVQEMPVYSAKGSPQQNEVYQAYVEGAPGECRAPNLVSNIILDYRAYDTLLETTSLFAVVMAIILMWGTGRKEQ